MNKALGTFALLGALAMASCKGRDGHGHPPDSAADSSYIPVDSANKMISSYITSLGSSPDNLHSLLLNADALRDYLNSSAGTDAKTVKIMFAHTLDYINSGNGGQPCGYGSGKLTVVLAGYDAQGSYLLEPQGTGIDFCMPCPSHCPAGEAAGDLLPTAGTKTRK